MQFSLHGLYERGGRPPKITNNGLKLMQIELRGTKTTCHVVFRDSCLLFPMKLDDIPETFSVTDKVRKVLVLGNTKLLRFLESRTFRTRRTASSTTTRK